MAFRWIYCIPRHEHMRTYLLNCNTMSFKFLINQKLLCFVCNLNAGKSCLLSKLTAWYITSDELTNVMKSYELWRINNINAVKSSVKRVFELRCNEL